jgi:beta-D-xylosidase 4
MPTSRYLAALSLVAGGANALFPDCTNGPLKNMTICDKSASKLLAE